MKIQSLVNRINSNWATKHLRADNDKELLKKAFRQLDEHGCEIMLRDDIVSFFVELFSTPLTTTKD